ncbi:hypothetical protein FRC18_001875 [Serendipita sp. 400]|nr:hypothetical protein FRC18_001875 [Serendipita sp. 400]
MSTTNPPTERCNCLLVGCANLPYSQHPSRAQSALFRGKDFAPCIANIPVIRSKFDRATFGHVLPDEEPLDIWIGIKIRR